jgi:hypothetical protein
MAAGPVDEFDMVFSITGCSSESGASARARTGLAMAWSNQASSAGMPSSLYTPAEARSLINQADHSAVGIVLHALPWLWSSVVGRGVLLR